MLGYLIQRYQKVVIQYMQQQDHNSKIERIALELNKNGLSYLSNQQSPSCAFDYFKKAQKMLTAEVQVDSSRKNIQRLLAVTSNNIAIYYKRTNKPKAALTYLKNALQIETFILEDWLATATTHLNICAIYSYMGKHQEAVDHANLSIENAKKAMTQAQQLPQKDSNFVKSCSNVELASIYNLAVEYEHLKRYQQAIETYKKSRDAAKTLGRKNIQSNSQESIDRLSGEMNRNKKKIIELLQKKKQNEERGNYESMRRNKKNFKSQIAQDQPSLTRGQQYNIYKDYQKRTQSVSKLVSIRPLRSQSTHAFKGKKQHSGRKDVPKDSGRQNKLQ